MNVTNVINICSLLVNEIFKLISYASYIDINSPLLISE